MKQTTMPRVLTLLLGTLALTMMPKVANANIIGFDFGSSFFKVSLVQPGKPFQIVENTTGGRKTDSMMTIAKEQRLFGKDAFIGQSRYYQNTFYDMTTLLGLEYTDENLEMLGKQFILNDYVKDERGLLAFQSFSLDPNSDETLEYFAEEMISMILKYGRDLAEYQANGDVRDAVITVPSYYSQEKREMMIKAADLAGLKVEQLVHENTAAATMYGIDRMDTEKDIHVLYYNMGATDTEVSVVRYSAVVDGKTDKTHEYVEILGEGYDETLGGKEFDHVLVNILADEFNGMKERQGKSDIRENKRAMRRLYKEIGKTKDVLSANRITDVKVPELADYVTLFFKLDRDTFEAKSEHLFQRVQKPIETALQQAGLTADDIDQVEILGGGLRIPKVQQIIKETMKTEELHVHLNGDEAMCFGAAFMASNSSSSFKVRKVYLTQHPQFSYKIEISPMEPVDPAEVFGDSEGEEGEKLITYEKDAVLYKRTDYLGQKKTISISYDRAMKIEVYALKDIEGQEEPESKLQVTYTLPSLDEIGKNEVALKEGSTKPKVTLNFELTRSHLFKLKSASATIDEKIIEEVVIEKKQPEAETEEKKEDSESEEKKGEDENEATSESESSEEGEEKTEGAEETEKEVEIKERTETHSFTVDVNENMHRVRLLSTDNIKAAKRRMKDLDKRDEEKKLTDEAKNKFESLIYEFRDFLRDEDNFVFVKESDRETLLQKCEDSEEWLYDAGSDVNYKVYQEKNYDLLSEYSTYKNRKVAAKERDEAVPKYLEEIQDTKTKAIEIREKMPWVTEQEQNDLLEKVDETKQWLEEKIEAQAALNHDEEPAYKVDDIEAKMKKLTTLSKKIFSKKKPKEPKKKKEEDKEEKKEEESKTEGNDDEQETINLDDEEPKQEQSDEL